jgi:dihydroorotate dehydrogenase (NAD+) catalytic subunit
MGKDIDLRQKIGDLLLKNPLITASGCLEYDEELLELIPLNEFGAFTTKTITLNKMEGNPMPRTCEVASGLLNSIGLQNEGLYDYIGKKLPKLRENLQIPIIASIGGFKIEEFATLASHLDREEGVSAIEVNISCPNIEAQDKWGINFSQDEHMSYGVVKAVRESTTKPLIVKLSPDVTQITAIAQAVVDAGADAVVIANTFPAMAIDIEDRKPKLGNIVGGLSGPAIKPIILRKVWQVYKSGIGVPIIACGGIMTPNDALEYIIAGANFISIGTVNFINPKAGIEILEGIRDYLTQKGLTFNELVGSLKIEGK